MVCLARCHYYLAPNFKFGLLIGYGAAAGVYGLTPYRSYLAPNVLGLFGPI
jgi:hypothetical protein